VLVVSLRRTYLFSLVVIVTAFMALYPCLGAMEMCDSGECPMAMHSSVGISTACLVVVLAAAPVVLFALRLHLRRAASELRPLQVFSSPDPPPPRAFLSW
jgi:uncharacterized membrane protein